MKYLGVDFGSKRVGIATSDESGTLAKPFTVLKNDAKLIAEIEAIVNKENVGAIVVGDSTGNKVQNDITEFIGTITLATFLPVEKVTEAFTSVEAHGRKGKEQKNARQTKVEGKPKDLDARAAAVILQRYLDKKSKGK